MDGLGLRDERAEGEVGERRCQPLGSQLPGVLGRGGSCFQLRSWDWDVLGAGPTDPGVGLRSGALCEASGKETWFWQRLAGVFQSSIVHWWDGPCNLCLWPFGKIFPVCLQVLALWLHCSSAENQPR